MAPRAPGQAGTRPSAQLGALFHLVAAYCSLTHVLLPVNRAAILSWSAWHCTHCTPPIETLSLTPRLWTDNNLQTSLTLGRLRERALSAPRLAAPDWGSESARERPSLLLTAAPCSPCRGRRGRRSAWATSSGPRAAARRGTPSGCCRGAAAAAPRAAAAGAADGATRRPRWVARWRPARWASAWRTTSTRRASPARPAPRRASPSARAPTPRWVRWGAPRRCCCARRCCSGWLTAGRRRAARAAGTARAGWRSSGAASRRAPGRRSARPAASPRPRRCARAPARWRSGTGRSRCRTTWCWRPSSATRASWTMTHSATRACWPWWWARGRRSTCCRPSRRSRPARRSCCWTSRCCGARGRGRSGRCAAPPSCWRRSTAWRCASPTASGASAAAGLRWPGCTCCR